MHAQLVNGALLMALWKRKLDKGSSRHTSRGSPQVPESSRTRLK